MGDTVDIERDSDGGGGAGGGTEGGGKEATDDGAPADRNGFDCRVDRCDAPNAEPIDDDGKEAVRLSEADCIGPYDDSDEGEEEVAEANDTFGCSSEASPPNIDDCDG